MYFSTSGVAQPAISVAESIRLRLGFSRYVFTTHTDWSSYVTEGSEGSYCPSTTYAVTIDTSTGTESAYGLDGAYTSGTPSRLHLVADSTSSYIVRRDIRSAAKRR